MGYLPMVMLLCLLGLGRSADDAAVEGNSSYGEESEGTYPTRRPSSTEPMPMRQMFGDDASGVQQQKLRLKKLMCNF